MSNKSLATCIIAIVAAIAGLESWALYLGFDGVILASSIAGMIGLPVYLVTKRRRDGN